MSPSVLGVHFRTASEFFSIVIFLLRTSLGVSALVDCSTSTLFSTTFTSLASNWWEFRPERWIGAMIFSIYTPSTPYRKGLLPSNSPMKWNHTDPFQSNFLSFSVLARDRDNCFKLTFDFQLICVVLENIFMPSVHVYISRNAVLIGYNHTE